MPFRVRMLLGCAILLFGLRPANAAALVLYLDPGTASLALQMLLAGVLGGLLLVKLMWRRIVGLVTGKNPESVDPSASDESTPSAEDPKE